MSRLLSTLPAVPVIACLSLVTLLAACGSPNNPRYDANGQPVASMPDYPSNKAQRQINCDYGYDNDYYATRRDQRDNPTLYHDYDRNGQPIHRTGQPIPENMLPPRGMCRIWFTQRNLAEQPSVESCDAIRARVPVGAYVVYGG